MKHFTLSLLILGLIVLGCNQKATSYNKTENSDKEEIQKLIRQALSWANSKNSIELFPAKADQNDSLYVGFDFDALRMNLLKLKETNFFSENFIENYNRIILILDSKIKKKEFENWEVGEMQPFSFSYDVNPWCYCQEIPDNNPWERVDIKLIKLDKEGGDFTWSWAKSDWPSDFEYSFRVVKEDGKWKIDYLSGFDYDESIKRE